MTRFRDDGALKPIGFALTAVVAGLGAGAVQAGPAAETVRAYAPDDSLNPAHDEDPALILGPSEAVEPFAEAAPAPKQNFFDL